MEHAIRELLRSIYRFYRTFMIMLRRPAKANEYLFNPDSKLVMFFTEPRLFFILSSFLFAFIIRNLDTLFEEKVVETNSGVIEVANTLGKFIQNIQEVSLWEAVNSTLPILLITALEVPLLAFLFKKRNRSVFINFFLYFTSFQKLVFFVIVLLLSLVGAGVRISPLGNEAFMIFGLFLLFAVLCYAAVLPFWTVGGPMSSYLSTPGKQLKYIFICVLLPVNFGLFVYLEVAHNQDPVSSGEMIYVGEENGSVGSLRVKRNGDIFELTSDVVFRWNGSSAILTPAKATLVYDYFNDSLKIRKNKPFKLVFETVRAGGFSGPFMELKKGDLFSGAIRTTLTKGEMDTLYLLSTASNTVSANGHSVYLIIYDARNGFYRAPLDYYDKRERKAILLEPKDSLLLIMDPPLPQEQFLGKGKL